MLLKWHQRARLLTSSCFSRYNICILPRMKRREAKNRALADIYIHLISKNWAISSNSNGKKAGELNISNIQLNSFGDRRFTHAYPQHVYNIIYIFLSESLFMFSLAVVISYYKLSDLKHHTFINSQHYISQVQNVSQWQKSMLARLNFFFCALA